MLFRPGAGGRQRGEAPARSGGHGAQKKQGASRGGDALPCACMRHPCLEGHFVHVGSLGGEGGAQVIVALLGRGAARSLALAAGVAAAGYFGYKKFIKK